jgi:hypothetical protein
MASTTLVKTPRTIIAAGTTNAAAATTRGTLDLRTAAGGLLTIKITNGATGPTVQAQANILVAHNAGATPGAASAGTDWKTIWSFGGGTSNSAVTEQSITIDPAVMHLEVEVTGNTAQPVTCEAFFSEISNYSTV